MLGRIKSVRPLVETDEGKADGYCFITGEDGIDRFAHNSEVDAPLKATLVGLFVLFRPVLHVVKGPRAIDVHLLVNSPSGLES